MKVKTPDEIIKHSYEITIKEQIKDEIIYRDLEKVEIKALLKHDNILSEVYSEWLDEETGEQTGEAGHVGIVERSDNGIVYTIEGNTTGDICKQKQYDIFQMQENYYVSVRNNRS